MAALTSPAARAAYADMIKAKVDTSVFYKEDTICVFSGVFRKPSFNFLKGQHQGREFEKAYKKV